MASHTAPLEPETTPVDFPGEDFADVRIIEPHCVLTSRMAAKTQATDFSGTS